MAGTPEDKPGDEHGSMVPQQSQTSSPVGGHTIKETQNNSDVSTPRAPTHSNINDDKSSDHSSPIRTPKTMKEAVGGGDNGGGVMNERKVDAESFSSSSPSPSPSNLFVSTHDASGSSTSTPSTSPDSFSFNTNNPSTSKNNPSTNDNLIANIAVVSSASIDGKSDNHRYDTRPGTSRLEGDDGDDALTPTPTPVKPVDDGRGSSNDMGGIVELHRERERTLQESTIPPPPSPSLSAAAIAALASSSISSSSTSAAAATTGAVAGKLDRKSSLRSSASSSGSHRPSRPSSQPSFRGRTPSSDAHHRLSRTSSSTINPSPRIGDEEWNRSDHHTHSRLHQSISAESPAQLLVIIRDFAFERTDPRFSGLPHPDAGKRSSVSSRASRFSETASPAVGNDAFASSGSSAFSWGFVTSHQTDFPSEDDSQVYSEDDQPTGDFIRGIYAAIYDFEPELETEMGVKSGDVVTVFSRQCAGWVQAGRIIDGEMTGEVGLVPENYLTLLEPDDILGSEEHWAEDDEDEVTEGEGEAGDEGRSDDHAEKVVDVGHKALLENVSESVVPDHDEASPAPGSTHIKSDSLPVVVEGEQS